MKLRTFSLLLAAVCVAGAADYPASAGFVNDFTGTIPDAVQQALELRLRAYERATSNEIAVAIVPSLEGDSVEDYARGLFKAWGIGKSSRDNGVLFLWAPTEHKLRIQVGYGLESVLTDSVCAGILDKAVPLFRAGSNSDGVRTVVDSIIQRIGEAAPPAGEPASAPKGDSSSTLLVAGIVLLAVALLAMQYHTRRAHYLQTEVPREIALSGERLHGLKDSAAEASANLEALRAEAPPEVWNDHQAAIARAPAALQELRDRLNAIEAQRREEYRELRSAYRGLREWSRLHERTVQAFGAVGTTLQQFRESQDQVVTRIPQVAETLHRVASEVSPETDERTRKLMQAAQETFDRVRELRQEAPVNWLLLRDLLADVQDCLDRLECLMRADGDPKEKRRAMLAPRGQRYWQNSAQCSSANQELIVLMNYWNWNSGTAGADAGTTSSFSGFGGGDTGSGGASASY